MGLHMERLIFGGGGLIFRMASVLVNIYGPIHRGLILGGGGLYSEVYGILLSNVPHILAESYNSRQYNIHTSGKY